MWHSKLVLKHIIRLWAAVQPETDTKWTAVRPESQIPILAIANALWKREKSWKYVTLHKSYHRDLDTVWCFISDRAQSKTSQKKIQQSVDNYGTNSSHGNFLSSPHLWEGEFLRPNYEKENYILKKKSSKPNTKDFIGKSTNVTLPITHIKVLTLFASKLSDDTRCHVC